MTAPSTAQPTPGLTGDEPLARNNLDKYGVHLRLPVDWKCLGGASLPARNHRKTTMLNRLIFSIGGQSASLRRELKKAKQYQATLLERNEKLKARVQELMEKYRNARAGQDGIDPLGHNSVEGMDTFFAEIPNSEPYIEFGRALAKVLEQHEIRIDKRRVADFGTGPRLMLKALLDDRSPASVTGYDFSETGLAHARRIMPEAKFYRNDIYTPVNESYDIILCTEVLEHLEHPAQAIAAMLESLAPEGTMVLTVPDGRIDFSRYHINFWSPESWQIFVCEVASGYHVEFDSFRIREAAAYQNNLAIIHRTP